VPPLPKRIGHFEDVIEEYQGQPIRNPMDEINNHRRQMVERAAAIRRMKFCAVGIVVCVAAQFFILSLMPSPEELKEQAEKVEGSGKGGSGTGGGWFPKTQMDTPSGVSERFQGKPVVIAAGGQKILAVDEKSGEDVELVPTGTSTIPHFPKTIHLPTSSTSTATEEYTLLGLGIRTVSFLSIQVYVVGLYIQTSSLASLQANLIRSVNPIASALIPGEKEQLKQSLLDGEESQKMWNSLLTDKASHLNMAVRVVPTRSTDFGHLRDGWVRGITAKTQALSAAGSTEFNDDSFGAAMKEFKALLGGKGKAPKDSVVLLQRDASGALTLLFQEKNGTLNNFGTISDERIARLVWLGYLGGKNVSSEGARKGIVDGIIELVERPIGSVETKVS
jgi:hypothetical protein